MVHEPSAELYRSLWCVDHWEVVHDEDDPWQPFGGIIHLGGESHEAAGILTVARNLVAELRRLRPELTSVADDAS
jgi:hypothetical protein